MVSNTSSSACVMNVITYSMAYALYPNTMFNHHVSLAISNGVKKQGPARAKYVKRGWRYVAKASASEISGYLSKWRDEFVAGGRFVGDKKTWKIGVWLGEGTPSNLGDNLRLNSWSLVYRTPYFGYVDMRVVNSSHLRFKLATNDEQLKILAELWRSTPASISRYDVV
jgi:hypothetical protein